MERIISIGVMVISTLILLGFFGFFMSRIYKRATRETSLVRTGAGGRKVVVDGGIIVVPMLHDLMKVNMKTLRLEVRRRDEESLITKDRLRVDVGVEFYIRVMSTEDGIAKAAQTLGQRTFDVQALKEMVEGKLVDGLRSVAALMTMDDLHEQRSHFVQEVQKAVSEDLIKNGLELESVSLTLLDQTPFDKLDENNAFNAIGMRKLAEVVSQAKRERAKIESQTTVEIARAEQAAAISTYQVEQEQEHGRGNQSVGLIEMRATETAARAQHEETARSAAEVARVNSQADIETAEIKRKQALEIAEVERRDTLNEAENRVRIAQIARSQEADLAEQDRKIAVSQRSEQESQARAAADEARATAVIAEESIVTARAKAEAARASEVELIAAKQRAETEATAIRVSAQAERDAAKDRAEAQRETAQAEADAQKLRAEGLLATMTAEAEGRAKIVAADNEMSEDIIAMKLTLQRLEALPAIIAEMVKPLSQINDIRIHQIGGLNTGASASAAGGVGEGQGGAGPSGTINQLFDSVQGMMLQAPALRAIGEAAGLTLGDGIKGVLESEFPQITAKPEEAIAKVIVPPVAAPETGIPAEAPRAARQSQGHGKKGNGLKAE